MSQPESNGVTGSPPTIYVVDDEQVLLDLAEMILEPAGFDVCLFRDPQKALAEYSTAQPPPDVLVTDYAMGRMNGMDLIRECKRLNPQQKTILLATTVPIMTSTTRVRTTLQNIFSSFFIIVLAQYCVRLGRANSNFLTARAASESLPPVY